MSTDIEWTDETWNPVTGCTKVSPGCDHCYAERVTERWSGKGSFEKVVLHPERLGKPLHWRNPRKVFVNSMSDLFHEDVPAAFITEVFAVMSLAPQHTFQILTKRHGRMRTLLSRDDFEPTVREVAYDLKYGDGNSNPCMNDRNYQTWPLPNVWLGVSVEDQKWADIRIPILVRTPAAVRFLSCEPLLGRVDIRGALGFTYDDRASGERVSVPAVDWVIVGGESGPGSRAMSAGLALSIRDQCVKARVPFLFKQWGGITPKAGGRLLDGRTWDEYPQTLTAATS